MTTKANKLPATESTLFTWARVRIGLLVGLALLILWLGVKGWRIGRAVQSLLAQQAAAETLMAEGISGIDPTQADQMVHTIRQDVVTLRDETAVFMPLTRYLGWLPKVGPLTIAAPHLMEMADAGTETAVHAYEGLKPALSVMQSDTNSGSPLPQLVNVLAEARPKLALAQQSFQRVVTARQQINNVDQFPERVQTAFVMFDEWLPLAQDGLVMVQVLPNILGHEAPRSYLLLAQNEDEIRATGGFISGVGLLTLDNGDILSLDFQDASTFDLESLAANSAAYDYPPQPLQDLMGADYLLLRDANYWPDFPFTAQKAIELYQIGQPDIPIDGVIAIDQQFIAMLVEATGPIPVAGSDTVITGANAVQSFRDAFNIKEGQTNAEWFQNRKAFLSTFSAAIRQKIETDPAALDMVTLARNMFAALNERHLQLYMHDPEVTAVLTELDWDGRLENPVGQDFLLVLDTNMGFNKTNLHIDRTFVYEVDLSTSHPQAHLSIKYHHNGPESEDPCFQHVYYNDAPTYQEVADQCYFNYLRVYSPQNSELQWMTEHNIPGEVTITGNSWERSGQAQIEFADFTTFTNFLMVPRNETLTTEIAYSLPETAVQRQDDNQQTYQLWLRKQAGMEPESVSVTLILPEGAVLLESQAPQDPIVNGRTVTFTFDLLEDSLISLTFES
ncbi:MAG: DUF4012 domain-containing protein [Anaerolineaceae bacterium]|nr:DUF4012 domain-containing protein [Anaerolineaceae bacterium]